MSPDHHPRTLLMAAKTSSGLWSTLKAAVKLWACMVLSCHVMDLVVCGLLGPSSRVRALGHRVAEAARLCLLRGDGLRGDERRTLALHRLDRTVAPALGQGP